MTIPFGRRSSASTSMSSDGSTQVQVQNSVAEIGQWGYQALLSAGNGNHEFVQGQHKAGWALLTGGVDIDNGATTLRMEAQGSVSLVDRGLFSSNTIYDSFAIVDTNGLAGVRVLQENRDVGATSSRGRLLVPDMRSFDLNHIAVSPGDIPMDVSIETPSREVRPQDHSGVVVRFHVRVSHGALLRLVDEHGLPVPVGSTARLKGGGVKVPVGYDGDAYMEDLAPHNEVTIDLQDERQCSVAFDYSPVAGEVPSIGPLTCREQKQ